MKAITAVAILAALMMPRMSGAGVAPEGALDGIGDIVEIRDLFKPLCSCGRGLELVDAEGRAVKVALGPGWDGMTSGFRIGATAAGDSASMVVEKGSDSERRLLDLMWGYLDRNYAYWEQQSLGEPETPLRRRSPKDEDSAYLLEFLRGFERQEELQRWLDHNLSRDEQERIFGTPYEALETDFERRVFACVCEVRGGGTFVYSTAEHREVGGGFSEITSGTCR